MPGALYDSHGDDNSRTNTRGVGGIVATIPAEEEEVGFRGQSLDEDHQRTRASSPSELKRGRAVPTPLRRGNCHDDTPNIKDLSQAVGSST